MSIQLPREREQHEKRQRAGLHHRIQQHRDEQPGGAAARKRHGIVDIIIRRRRRLLRIPRPVGQPPRRRPLQPDAREAESAPRPGADGALGHP